MKLLRSTLTMIGFALVASIASAQANLCIIARLKPSVSPQFVAAAYGVSLLDTAPFANYAYFGTSSTSQQAAVEAAMRLDTANIVWVEDDREASVTESTNGKGGTLPQLRAVRLGVQYSPGAIYSENVHLLQQIHWSYRPSSKEPNEVRVAILDTGLSPLQPTLWDRTIASATFVPRETRAWDYRSSPALGNNHSWPEVTGHGTMVAGLIAQLAPESSLIIARICDNHGQTTAWRIAKGLSFAMENGATIANLSIGSVDQIAAISNVLEDAEFLHLLVIAPLGNNNLEQALYPARYSHVLGVSGVDPSDIKAPFSNYHNSVDISAPATGIKSAWWQGGMAVWHGTSFAAPIVAGCLAEAMKTRPIWEVDAILDAANQFGDDIDGINPNYADKLGPRVNLDKIRIALDNL